MALMSVLGLGLAARPEALKTLNALRTPDGLPNAAAIRARLPMLDRVLAEALKAGTEISRDGLKPHYERIQPRFERLPDVRGVPPVGGPPVIGAVPALRSGTLLTAPAPGEQIKAPTAGDQLRAPTAGEVLTAPRP